jgi:hypothetical protein
MTLFFLVVVAVIGIPAAIYFTVVLLTKPNEAKPAFRSSLGHFGKLLWLAAISAVIVLAVMQC